MDLMYIRKNTEANANGHSYGHAYTLHFAVNNIQEEEIVLMTEECAEKIAAATGAKIIS